MMVRIFTLRYHKIVHVVLVVLCTGLLYSLFKRSYDFKEILIWRAQDQHEELLKLQKPCAPVNYVLFAKLHKTGSSTVTNILNRYGDKRDLNFLLPVKTGKGKSVYNFYWPYNFRLRFVASLFNREANILCNHARYDSKAMHWLFPKERSHYITMLREPSTQFESVFNFMHFANSLKIANYSDPLGTFLESPRRFLHNPKGVDYLIRNPMMFDLGYPETSYDNLTMAEAYIQRLANEFDLVMIMEYFDESLVLLKRTLCWQTEDILYFKLNERREKDRRPDEMSERNKRLIGEWSSADTKLYDYFNKTFWKKIAAEGSEFYEDLQIFRDKKRTKEEACLKEGNYVEEAYTGKFVKGYALKQNLTTDGRETCERMIRNEITYVDYLHEKLRLRILDFI